MFICVLLACMSIYGARNPTTDNIDRCELPYMPTGAGNSVCVLYKHNQCT